eukprot:1426340-Rhodomonas_salina.2
MHGVNTRAKLAWRLLSLSGAMYGALTDDVAHGICFPGLDDSANGGISRLPLPQALSSTAHGSRHFGVRA